MIVNDFLQWEYFCTPSCVNNYIYFVLLQIDTKKITTKTSNTAYYIYLVIINKTSGIKTIE